MFFFNVENQQF